MCGLVVFYFINKERIEFHVISSITFACFPLLYHNIGMLYTHFIKYVLLIFLGFLLYK